MTDTNHFKEIAPCLQPLFELPRWVPWARVERDGKITKVPRSINNQFNASTKNPKHWGTFVEAAEAVRTHRLSGVGVVITDGIEQNNWRLLAGDIDRIDQDNPDLLRFITELNTYTERSPSGEGIRFLAWVPAGWAKRFADTTSLPLPGADHMEIYLGTSARFVTITFDALNIRPPRQLDESTLQTLSEMLKPATQDRVRPKTALGPGKVLNLDDWYLTPTQRDLVEGRVTDMDRSRVLHGLLIRLFEHGASREDALATILRYEPLWQFCLDHRRQNEKKAKLFAEAEVMRAWEQTVMSRESRLGAYHQNWLEKAGVVETPADIQPEPRPAKDLLHPPGLVGELADVIEQGAIYPHRLWSIGAALLTISAVQQNQWVVGCNYTPLNLYLLLLGSTGSGKDWYRNAPGIILGELEMEDLVIADVASGQALLRRLKDTPGLTLLMDEISHMFAAMQAKGNFNGAMLEKELLSLYSAATSRYHGKVYADARNSIGGVDNPFMQVMGVTTPEMFWDLMGQRHIEAGLLGRFMPLKQDANPVRNWDQKYEALPADLRERLLSLADMTWRAKMLVGETPTNVVRRGKTWFRHLPFTEEAMELYKKADVQYTERVKRSGSQVLWGRALEKATKVAGLLALGLGLAEVTKQEMQYGLDFVEASTLGMVKEAEETMNEGEFDALCKKALRWVRLGGFVSEEARKESTNARVFGSRPGRLARSLLLKRLKVPAWKLDEVVSYLTQTGDLIEEVEEPDKTRYYRTVKGGFSRGTDT